MDNSEKAASIFSAKADLYLSKYSDISAYHKGLLAFLSHLRSDAQLLDLACGPGIQAEFLLQHSAQLHYEGWDLAENMIRLARERLPDLSFLQADARTFKALKKYDGILLSFLLPYLEAEEAKDLITQCALSLQKDGSLYLSFITAAAYTKHESHPSDDPSMKIYMHHYPIAEIEAICLSQGLKIIYREELQNPNGDREGVLVFTKP